MFLVDDRLVLRDKTVPRAPELNGARAFYAFRSFQELKSSYSQDNMPVNA